MRRLPADNGLANGDLQDLLSEENERNRIEIETNEIAIEQDSKSDENNQLQSQVEEVKSKLNARPNIDQEDKSFDAEFQVSFDTYVII